MTSTPPGWYDDGHGATRWWDGARWSEHARPATVATVGEQQPAAPGGTAVPAGGPKRRWLLPVLIAGSLAVLVLLAIVLVPVIAKTVVTSGYSADERAAVETVRAYDAAWQSGDCKAFEATTTEGLRTAASLADCVSFEDAASAFQQATDDYEIEVTDVTSAPGAITVRTAESYTSFLDDQDKPVSGFEAVSTIDYTLVRSDGHWLIDSTVAAEE
jgi:hypothetical protein